MRCTYKSALNMRSNWFSLELITFFTDDSLQPVDKDQQESRAVAGKPHVRIQRRCNSRNVSKFTAAWRGSPTTTRLSCTICLIKCTDILFVMNLFPPVACSVECRTSATRSDWRFHRNRRKQSTNSVSSLRHSTRRGNKRYILPHHHPEHEAADRHL